MKTRTGVELEAASLEHQRSGQLRHPECRTICQFSGRGRPHHDGPSVGSISCRRTQNGTDPHRSRTPNARAGLGEWRLGCTPDLHDAPGRSSDCSDEHARGIPIPAVSQMLIECGIQR